VPRDDVFDRLRKVLASEFRLDEDAITPEARMVDDLDLDSVDAVAMLVRLEEETGLALGDEEVRGLVTVGDVVELLRRHAGETG